MKEGKIAERERDGQSVTKTNRGQSERQTREQSEGQLDTGTDRKTVIYPCVLLSLEHDNSYLLHRTIERNILKMREALDSEWLRTVPILSVK